MVLSDVVDVPDVVLRLLGTVVMVVGVMVVVVVVFGRERVQLVNMVLDTSRGMMKMMRNEKYQAVNTASVTRIGCLIQFEYLHSNTAAKTKAIQRSNKKTE